MFAVVKTGGKQYKVQEGDVIAVEKIEGEPGSEIDLGPALMAGDGDNIEVGTPVLEGRNVTARILSQGKGPKITILKHLRRKDSRKKTGHRQKLTELRIVSLGANAAKEETPDGA